MRLTSRKVVLYLAVATAAAATLAASAPAATLQGYVYDPMWSDYTTGHEAVDKGYAGMPVSATKEGGPAVNGCGGAETWAGEPVGFWNMSLEDGTYSVMYHEKDEWARFFTWGQVVSGSLTLYRIIRYQDLITAWTWDPHPRHNWAQSFVAKGNWVSQVGIQQAIEFGPGVQISIHDDTGPDGSPGAQIGPSRLVPTVVVNPSSAYWSAGEVPTTPGKTYWAKFHVPDPGVQPFLAGATLQGGWAYPDGRAWRDATDTVPGGFVNTPLKCTIYQDTDGIISVVSTKKTNSTALPLMPVTATVAGQTFRAMGTSLLSFSCLVGNTGGLMIVTVYQSPGTNGEGVNQVGVAKYMKAIDWNTRSGVVWKPGEVPLTAGQDYYVKVKRADNASFVIYHVNANEYQNGTAYINGAAMSYDLSTTICAEAFAGSTTQPKIRISAINVTRGTTTATVNWTTDVVTSTNYVDYGEATPYDKQKAGDPGGTAHSVTLTNLQPNKLYHYRVVSKTAGRYDAYSRDFVFCTQPDTSNLLANPGFENGSNISPWVGYSIYNAGAAARNYPWTPGGDPSFFSMQARQGGGNWFYGGANNGSKCKGGVYQRVPAMPGREYRLRAWVCTYQTDPIGGQNKYNSLARVGLDPTGGTSSTSPNVIWGPWNCAQDIVAATEEGNGKGYWTEAWISAAAASNYVTVFLEAGSDADMRWTVWGLDDAVLTEVASQPLTRISQLASVPDGTLVQIADKIVTASRNPALSFDANYIEEPDRSCAVRVESTTSFTLGNKVTVQGVKGTKVTGEAYLYNAAVISSTASTVPGTLTAVARNVGQVGPGNVAMLMKVVGKIAYGERLTIWINDGSLPDLGLKLNDASLSVTPDEQEYYAITGIVELQGTSPSNAIPVLHPRSDADVVKL